MDRAVKRPREENGVLPETQVIDAEYKRWGVAETGAFLRREGLQRWEQTFTGTGETLPLTVTAPTPVETPSAADIVHE